MNVTISITTPASGPFNVYKALTGVAQSGCTVKPTVPPLNATLSGRTACQYIAIQNDGANAAATVVYEGDATILADGTCQGNSIALGNTHTKNTSGINALSLINQYVNSSGAAKVNIDVNFV